MNDKMGQELGSAPQAFDITPPRAASLVESLRAFGYDLPTAIADLIDNSIAAGARTIWVDFHWAGRDSVATITDDGNGMAKDQLVAAMRLGSRSPLETRTASDLGRFGLGLKTASFSQCRSLTVRTRMANSTPVTRRWDLDHIARTDDWQLLRSADAEAEPHLQRINEMTHGTSVLWQNLDRLTGHTSTDNEKQHQAFLDQVDKVRKHLGMVFHELMVGASAVEIILNGNPITPWDPFLLNEAATQILTATRLTLRNSTVEIQPYVLPHQSKMSRAAFDAAAGPHGWIAHEGFYVYRGRRLLVPGDWLGFGWSKEDHYKLARIRVEIPNSLDEDWKIDVTKSRAIPPPQLREEFRRIGTRTREEARRIYSHRGAKLVSTADSDRIFAWEPISRHDKTSYRLNREHPLLKRAFTASSDKRTFGAFVRLIEETVPFPHITLANSERPGSLAAPFDHAKDAEIREIMEQAYGSLIASGYGAEEAINRLRTVWPFELFPSLLESIRETKAYG